MADINDGLPPAKPDQAVTEHRPTGATYKLLLKAILAATGHDNFDVAVVVPNHAVKMRCMQMVHSITLPLHDFVHVRYHSSGGVIAFNNGSEIRFYVPEQEFRGQPINMLLVDESWYSLVSQNSAHEWVRRLRQHEQPHGVRKGG